MELIQVWLGLPIVQLCAAAFLICSVLVVLRLIRGKPIDGEKK